MQGSLVKLNVCKKSGSQVFCDLTITNNGVDREVGFGNLTKIFDDLGNTYPSKNVSVAGQNNSTIYADFINKVKVKVRFTFENVALDATKIKLFSIIVAPQKSSKFTVSFQDIEFR